MTSAHLAGNDWVPFSKKKLSGLEALSYLFSDTISISWKVFSIIFFARWVSFLRNVASRLRIYLRDRFFGLQNFPPEAFKRFQTIVFNTVSSIVSFAIDFLGILQKSAIAGISDRSLSLRSKFPDRNLASKFWQVRNQENSSRMLSKSI